MLTTYQTKPYKSAISLSKHHDKFTTPSNKVFVYAKNKLNIIFTYNSNKCGVDSVDQMTQMIHHVVGLCNCGAIK